MVCFALALCEEDHSDLLTSTLPAADLEYFRPLPSILTLPRLLSLPLSLEVNLESC